MLAMCGEQSLTVSSFSICRRQDIPPVRVRCSLRRRSANSTALHGLQRAAAPAGRCRASCTGARDSPVGTQAQNDPTFRSRTAQPVRAQVPIPGRVLCCCPRWNSRPIKPRREGEVTPRQALAHPGPQGRCAQAVSIPLLGSRPGAGTAEAACPQAGAPAAPPTPLGWQLQRPQKPGHRGRLGSERRSDLPMSQRQ